MINLALILGDYNRIYCIIPDKQTQLFNRIDFNISSDFILDFLRYFHENNNIRPIGDFKEIVTNNILEPFQLNKPEANLTILKENI